MVIDKNNKIWVMCDGGIQGSPYGHEIPGMVRINAETRTVEATFRFNQDDRPGEMEINGTKDTLYFINHNVYRFATNSGDNPELFVESRYIGTIGGFYGLGVDPDNSDVYIADAIDYVQCGLVYRYSPHGIPLDTIRVGIAPRDFCFKPAGN